MPVLARRFNPEHAQGKGRFNRRSTQINANEGKTFVRLGFSGRVNVSKNLRVFRIFYNLRNSEVQTSPYQNSWRNPAPNGTLQVAMCMIRSIRAWGFFCASVVLTLARAWGDDIATNRVGFTGPEVFPIDAQIGALRAADLDGDGLLDLVVVDNARSKIDILYNQTGKTNAAPKKVKKEINELPPDSRFRIESIASEKRISSMVVADLNGDGRPDIAYYGDPKELVVIYNQGTNGWSAPKRFAIDDGQLTADALATGDLNGDGHTDLILLGENNIYLFAQNADHTLREPEKIPFSGVVKSVQVLDIDGDGRDDLLLVNWDSPNPFRFRLQTSEGQLGPEIHFSMPPIRSYMAEDLDGDHKAEIVTIAQNSGRAQVSTFLRKPAEPLCGQFKEGQLQVFPLNKTTQARRGLLWADVNGDGLADLLVAEPDSGQLTIYLQKPDGTLSAPKIFPTLRGVSDLAVGDWDGDGKAEIFLLSSDERQVGVTRMDKNGRVAFPTILPLRGQAAGHGLGAATAQSQSHPGRHHRSGWQAFPGDHDRQWQNPRSRAQRRF